MVHYSNYLYLEKIIEGYPGLKFQNRHAQEYYLSQLRHEQVQLILKAESESSLPDLVNGWLERIPFTEKERNG